MKHYLLADLLDLFYPSLCHACNIPLLKGEELICLNCKLELPETNYHNIEENPVERIFMGRVQIEKATAFFHFVKNGRIQSLLHHLKYKDKPELGLALGRRMGIGLNSSNFLKDVDLIVPIPLHPSKLKSRGYNQSEFIAQGISQASNKPLGINILERAVHSESQTKKSRFNRWLNVEKVFQVNKDHCSQGSHILLVDDVITTGSTAEAAASLFLSSGYKVSFCAMAIA